MERARLHDRRVKKGEAALNTVGSSDVLVFREVVLLGTAHETVPWEDACQRRIVRPEPTKLRDLAMAPSGKPIVRHRLVGS